MAIVITRTVVVPGWLLACALVVILSPSATMAIGLLLLSSGLALAANLVGRNTVRTLVADRFPKIDVRPVGVTAVERPAVWPYRWPDSGFRNIGRGTKGG
jgi:hypothetical protein